MSTTSQNLEEMAREERQENPSDLVHLDIRQLSDQTQQGEKCNSSNLGAFNDAPKDMVSPGGANSPASFCESKNTEILCKKEGEAGLRSAEGSGTVSDEDCTVSLCASVNGAVSLPCSGNTNEEAGMTSAGVVLDQAGVSSTDSARQELQTAEELAVSAAAVAAAAGEAPAPSEGLDVAMGQTECRNCAGAPERAKGQRRAEDGLAEPAERTARLEEKHPAEEESSSTAQPLLSGFNGTECSDGEDANVGVVPACDGANAGGDIGSGSVDLCKTTSNKETDVDLCTAQVNGDFTESQGDGSVTGRQEVTASTAEALPAVNGMKVPACTSDPATGLEVPGSSESGEQEGLVEAGCTDGKSSLPSLEDSVETDGPDAEPANRDVDGSNESGAEAAHCQESGEISDPGAAAMESSEKEPVGTDTSSCRDGGSRDSAGGGQEVAACAPSTAHTGVKDEMGNSFKPDTAQQGEREEREPASLPPEDVSAGLAEKEPAQAGAEKAENTSEQEGRSSKVESPLPREEGPAVSQEGDAAVAPPGQEAALQGNDPGSAPCAKGSDCAEDNLIGTPSATHNEESKQNQEAVAAGAGSAELAWQHGGEHGGAAATWPGDHAGDEGSPGQGHSQQAEGGKAKPEQEALVNGNEQVLSEELLAAVVKPFACSLEGPMVGSSSVDAGLKATHQAKEDCEAGAAVAAEGTMHGPASAEESLRAESDPCPNAGLNQEQDPTQNLQQICSTPELKDTSEVGALSDTCEGKEVPRQVTIAPVTAFAEQQEDTESVLPRAALQPIAEEPTCDSDSSTDTVCPAGDSDTALAGAQGEGLAEPHGKQSRAVPAVPFSPCSCHPQPVESLGNVEVKSLVSANGASSLDKVPKMVKSFDAVVFAADTPCSPEVPAAEKVELEPQTAVDARASLNGQMDCSSSTKKKNVSLAVQGAEPVTGMKNQLVFYLLGFSL